MNSYQIKPALTDFDLLASPLDTPPHIGIPRVFLPPPISSPAPLLRSSWHFSSVCHLKCPAECRGASVGRRGPKNVCGASCIYTFTKALNIFNEGRCSPVQGWNSFQHHNYKMLDYTFCLPVRREILFKYRRFKSKLTKSLKIISHASDYSTCFVIA